jgi:hypothetical protein
MSPPIPTGTGAWIFISICVVVMAGTIAIMVYARSWRNECLSSKCPAGFKAHAGYYGDCFCAPTPEKP